MPTLDWIGKQAVINHHREVPTRLLHCDSGFSAGAPDAGNLLVEGDNLEALKALLPYYAGQVKCIYIDPPYNTGNEGWAYNDNVNSPEINAWLSRVVGKEGEDLSRHDKWLSMMYPRLRLLRDFLRADGSIWVSCDENEMHLLRCILDELFYRRNFLTCFIWKKSYGGGSKANHFVGLHEYILCYAADISKLPHMFLPADPAAEKKYYKLRDDRYKARGPYRLQPLATTSNDIRPNLRYPIRHPDGRDILPEKQWQWSRERAEAALASGELVFTESRGRTSVSYKQYLKDADGGERLRKPTSIIEGHYTQQGTYESIDLFGLEDKFAFPKPEGLMSYIFEAATNKGDLVLDTFAGSGTTAAAAHKMGRRWLTVEMGGHAQTHTAKRLAAVVDGERGGISDQYNWTGGSGFRYCTLGKPLFDEWGGITEGVTFPDLAAFVFFSDTGSPIPEKASAETPLLGTFQDRAIYLLWSADSAGVASDRAGNVLTPERLANLSLPEDGFNGSRTIYAEGCTVTPERLAAAGVTFKQIPYQVAAA